MSVYGCGSGSNDGKPDDEVASDTEFDESGGDCANQAVVTPERSPAKGCGFNLFHASFGHAPKTLLEAPAKPIGVKRTGTLEECKDCILAKGIRTPTTLQTSDHSFKYLGRVLVTCMGRRSLSIYPGLLCMIYSTILDV